MAGWDTLPNLLKAELTQRKQEGCDTRALEDPVQAAIAAGDEAHINRVYDELMALPIQADFPFEEPSDLEGIRQRRPAGPRQLPGAPGYDRFLGAWLGRCAGCALGKPLEMGPFMWGAADNPGWKNVHLWFEQAGAWPIRDFTPGVSPFGKTIGLEQLRSEKSHLGNIRFMESDDDIRYTVLGLALLEAKGRQWTTWEMGKHWHNHLAYIQVCTAETQAYLNFAHVSSHSEFWNDALPADWQQKLAWVRTYRNPYREWIGAQIRADGLAYAAAGDPELAAEFAWRDASLSHVKNGIYGEMYVAAMIAAAFVESDVEKIVEIGLSEIPATSRLYRDLRQAIAITRASRSQLELVETLWNAFNHYGCVHTNNNAALVTASLLFAGDDFEQAIATAVLGGWDTDCNGATVGSIMGAKLGAQAIPQKWSAPFNDTLYSEIHGFHPIAISECARRSEALYQKLRGG
jgi:hypothetical protein